jgi:hypothetical protein
MDLVRRLVLSVKYYVLEIGSVLEPSVRELFLIIPNSIHHPHNHIQLHSYVQVLFCTAWSYCHLAVQDYWLETKQKDTEGITF